MSEGQLPRLRKLSFFDLPASTMETNTKKTNTDDSKLVREHETRIANNLLSNVREVPWVEGRLIRTLDNMPNKRLKLPADSINSRVKDHMLLWYALENTALTVNRDFWRSNSEVLHDEQRAMAVEMGHLRDDLLRAHVRVNRRNTLLRLQENVSEALRRQRNSYYDILHEIFLENPVLRNRYSAEIRFGDMEYDHHSSDTESASLPSSIPDDERARIDAELDAFMQE